MEYPTNTGFAIYGQSPEIRPTDERCPRTERDCLEHVGASAYAAVYEDFHFTPHGVYHFRQRVACRSHAIQLPPAVIRHADTRGTMLGGQPRIFPSENAFDHYR